MKRIVTKTAIALAAMTVAMISLATPTISGVTAQQRFPWNGLVDIVVTLQGSAEDLCIAECKFSATNNKTKVAISTGHIVRNGDDAGSGNVWMRKFVWDAKADVGTKKIEDVALVVDIKMLGVILWENGPCWSECNVGATYPEDAGYYFWWGDTEGYLRKSVVGDPIIRENTKDNTPAVIHYSIVPGDKVKITMAPKGFGSENMSRVFMLKPADGIEGVKNAILTAVKDAGPNACPPMVVGVGIGGTFEKCALLAKKALTRPVNEHSDIPYVKDLEIEMLEKINKLGIGPGGLGGSTTALAVNINTYPTHIAGLPVAINICCHVNRHVVREV